MPIQKQGTHLTCGIPKPVDGVGAWLPLSFKCGYCWENPLQSSVREWSAFLHMCDMMCCDQTHPGLARTVPVKTQSPASSKALSPLKPE